jgi:hypothetical protein
MKRLALVLILVTPTLCFGAGDYTIEELVDENATTSPPFSISSVVPVESGDLRLFLTTDNPDAVADLVADGALQAELSDHESETATSVSVFFGEAVWCTADDVPVYRAYRDPIPPCGDAAPAKIEYFFELAVTLGPGIDLAIGQDPDFLWLIEQVEEP